MADVLDFLIELVAGIAWSVWEDFLIDLHSERVWLIAKYKSKIYIHFLLGVIPGVAVVSA